MPDNSTTYTDGFSEQLLNAKQAISEVVDEAKDRTDQLGRKIVSKLDDTRVAAAEALHGASETIHAKANQAHSAAARLDSAAGYLVENDTTAMMGDARSFVSRHPGRSLLIAATVGFLAGRVIFHRD